MLQATFAGVKNLLIGMGVTFRNMLSKPVTLQYPEVKRTMPTRYRGRHFLNRDEDGLGTPLQTIEKAQVVFYLWDPSRSKSKQYNRPYNPQQSRPVQYSQNMIQEQDEMDDPLPIQDQGEDFTDENGEPRF